MSVQQFALPDVGEGLTEATVATWFVAAGQEIAVDEPLCEIETAKSLVELPSPWAGTVRELLVEAGVEVPVGTPLLSVETRAAAPAGESPARDVPGPGAPGALPTADSAPPSASPDAGSNDASGNNAGTSDAGGNDSDDDDADSTPDAGTGAPDGDEQPALLVGYGVREAPARRRRRDGAAPVAPPAPAPARAAARGRRPAEPLGPPPSAVRPGQVLAKPPVRRLARDLEIDLSAVVGTGPGGIVTREDVVRHHEAGDARALATYEGDDPWLEGGVVEDGGRRTRVPAKSVRRRTAEAMVQSAFTAPHVTEFHTVDVTRTVDLVDRLREDREFRGLHVTPLLIAMKALLLAVHRHPQINASWIEETQEIVYKHYVNLGVAAATPRGLVVPNIKDAHRLSLSQLAGELGELTEAARAGRTTPQATSDGTVTVTNVGAFGIDTGTPILNPGESAILAFGAVRRRPWVHDGELSVRWVTQLALSFDHRLVDGALGSFVLRDVARVLEDPGQALVWG